MKFISRIILFLSIITLGLSSCQQQHYDHPTVKIKTTYGDIFVALYPDKAPKTVANFLHYVEEGIYKNSNFYRVLKAEDQPSSADKADLIQGGINISNSKFRLAQKGIDLETTEETGLHHLDGTISMARTTPNSATTEFFICIGDMSSYDYGGNANEDKQGFAAFGKVIKGMDVVKDIQKRPSTGSHFDKPALIEDIVYLNPDQDQ